MVGTVIIYNVVTRTGQRYNKPDSLRNSERPHFQKMYVKIGLINNTPMTTITKGGLDMIEKQKSVKKNRSTEHSHSLSTKIQLRKLMHTAYTKRNYIPPTKLLSYYRKLRNKCQKYNYEYRAGPLI